jgi:mannose-6-phosphate isomerase-like protein (cupin superfamily)
MREQGEIVAKEKNARVKSPRRSALRPTPAADRRARHRRVLSFAAVGRQTSEAHALIETANQPSTGAPMDVHEREDETWLVLEGGFTFQVGDRRCSSRQLPYPNLSINL